MLCHRFLLMHDFTPLFIDEQIYITTDSYNYMLLGPVLTGLPQMMRGVKFSVEAPNDIHISVSSSNPITPSSWEIVLGGSGGLQSVIRRSHQGTHVVIIQHTRKQFLEVIIYNYIYCIV